MIWTFAGLGLLLLVAAAFGFITTVQSRSVLSAMHFFALFAIGLAWVLGHGTTWGWTALLLGLLLETLAWTWFSRLAGRAETNTPAPHDPSRAAPVPVVAETPSVKPASPETVMPTQPAPSSRPTWSLHSHALQRDFVSITPQVFLASLRRGGQRDARLVRESSPTDFQIEAAGLILEVRSHPAPLDARTLDYCLLQTFDRLDENEKAELRGHRAHVTLTSRADLDSSRAEWVRLHARAALAVAEFSPLVALAWPDAGKLIAAGSLRPLLDAPIDPAESCVTFRTYPLDDPPGAVLSDTVGLHALGLRDYQWITPGEPEDSVVTRLFEQVETDFKTGIQPERSNPITTGDNVRWVVSRDLSRFKPDRPVIDIRPLEERP